MYVSIDAARQQMAVHGAELWRRAIELADWARERIVELPGLRCLGARAARARRGRRVRPHAAHRLRLRPRPQRATSSRRCCATTTASPSRRPTRSTSCSTSPSAIRRDDVELLVGALRDLSARYADVTAEDAAATCSTLLCPHAAVHAPGALAARRRVRHRRAPSRCADVRRRGERRDGHAVPAGHPGAGTGRADLA